MKMDVLTKMFNRVGLDFEAINSLSVETGFIKRCRKIRAVEFLMYMITESIRGCVSCNDLAAVIEAGAGTMASRQAYHYKMSTGCVRFFETVLAAVMRSKVGSALHSRLGRFKRILIQDSTIIKLPARLLALFSGVGNPSTQVCNARIQSAFDLRGGSFNHWSIDPYSKNDIVAADELHIQAGDLILRDRGYYSSGQCRRIIEAKADFISRYRQKTRLHDPQTGYELDLCALLKTQRNMDRKVMIGTCEKVEVRLIAIEVSQETASRRRQKARKEYKGHNPGQKVLFLMGWTIFLTSITDSECTVDDFIELYGLRWRIETIIKTWKSHLGFSKIHIVSANQLRLILTARFIAITLFYQRIYVPLAAKVSQQTRKTLSLMKLMRYISRNVDAIPRLLDAATGEMKCLQTIARYCAYDKRKRLNFIDKQINILTAIDVICLT
jgi:hypothetical protein